MSNAPKIRVKAFAVLKRGDQLLVGLGEDTIKGDKFGRLVGGSVELGEHTNQTVIREMMEEFGITVKVKRHLGWLENIFTYNGEPGHEVIAVYEVTTDDKDIFTRDTMPVLDTNDTAAWLSPAEMTAKNMTLYPSGIDHLLG